MAALALFFQLVIGHAVGDFVLQPGAMSTGKKPGNDLRRQLGDNFPPWYYWMGAHSLTHAGIVWIITASPLFALIEAVSHWVIDQQKCRHRINMHQDQALHVAFKALYCVVIFLQ